MQIQPKYTPDRLCELENAESSLVWEEEYPSHTIPHPAYYSRGVSCALNNASDIQ